MSGPRLFDLHAPSSFPLALNPATQLIQLVELHESDYRQASFLDHQRLRAELPREWHPWADVEAAMRDQPIRCHFLFHISHVGSTLLSRLLGEFPSLFSLREPSLFRWLAITHPTLGGPGPVLANQEYAPYRDGLLRLWSRTFRPEQVSVIKATSFVSELAAELLDLIPTARAVAMTVTPVVFLKTMLGGAMSDITSQAEARRLRLNRRLSSDQRLPPAHSPGELVALAWLAEVAALQAAADRFPDRLLWLDFDRFLAQPAAALQKVLQYLGCQPEPALVEAVVAGPILRHYAKAPEHGYDANTRQQLLKAAEVTHYAELSQGMAWLRNAARLPLIRSLVQAAADREAAYSS